MGLDRFLKKEVVESKNKTAALFKSVLKDLNKNYESTEMAFWMLPKLKALDLHGPTFFRSGRHELAFHEYFPIVFEMAKFDVSIATFRTLHDVGYLLIANFLKSDVREKLLDETRLMDKTCAFALTEPDTGSDAASIETTAKKVDGGYILNG